MRRGFADVLDAPEIRRRTRRVLALREEEKQNEAERAYITADIGDELIATKAALDKNTWITWLSKHLNFTVQSADNYMKVARQAVEDARAGGYARRASAGGHARGSRDLGENITSSGIIYADFARERGSRPARRSSRSPSRARPEGRPRPPGRCLRANRLARLSDGT